MSGKTDCVTVNVRRPDSRSELHKCADGLVVRYQKVSYRGTTVIRRHPLNYNLSGALAD